MKLFDLITVVVLFPLVVGIILFLSSFITMWAWNLVMPSLFHLSHITLLQAFAVNILIGLVKGLFKVTVKK